MKNEIYFQCIMAVFQYIAMYELNIILWNVTD